MAPSLPSSVRLIVRGWLNCNQVVLLSPGDNVLIDSGYCTHRERTLELLASKHGLDRQPLERLVNTHCHSDHMGGNAAVASQYGCRVTIPAGEAKHVDPWNEQSVWMHQFDQRADPFHFDDTLQAGDAFEAGGFEWQCHAAPGHDMDALMFFAPRHRILVSGDALWRNGMGFVWPCEGANPFIAAAREALATIERLDPAIVVPGHGEPFFDWRGSVDTVRGKLGACEREPAKAARHMLKSMFVFALLERQSMALAEVPLYFARVPCYREVSAQFLGMDAAALAEWMVPELARGGTVAIANDTIRPAIAA
jgi:glyoxylase-like metal-dependent hydrolase (beta-lactamase superfamily II)